jgi:hypothetical protein
MGIHQGAKPNPKMLLDDKEYVVEKFFISELGYLMMRLYSEENKSYTTYNLGTHDPAKNIFNEAIEKQRS